MPRQHECPFKFYLTRDVACTLRTRILLQTYCQRIYYGRVQPCQIHVLAEDDVHHYWRIPLLNFANKFEKMRYVGLRMEIEEDDALNLRIYSLKKLNIEISRLFFFFGTR